MVYVMPAEMYWNYIEKEGFSHAGLIRYLNQTLILRGTITELHVEV